MKKTTRSILSLCLAVIMIAAMATTAFAAQTNFNTKETVSAQDDTDQVVLKKVYELIGDLANGASFEEEFSVKIEPLTFKNAPVGFTIANMPTVGTYDSETEVFTNIVKLTGKVTSENVVGTRVYAELTANVDLPDVSTSSGIEAGKFPEVGDYYYTVKEVASNTAGVTYDPSTYVLHVQVVKLSTGSIRLVTMHTATVTTTDGVEKVNMHDSKTDHILNKYSNGSLAITKTVSGNSGDLTKKFGVKVTFTSPEGKTVKNDISVSGVGVYVESANTDYSESKATNMTVLEAGDDGWTGTKTVVMYMANNEGATFTNIPYGVTYTVQELDYSSDGYAAPTYTLDKEAGTEEGDDVDGEGWAKIVNGKISDREDTVSIQNSKDTTIDIGVVLEDAPFVMLIVVSVAALGAFLVIRRKREI